MDTWTEESGGLQSMRLQRVGHDCVTNTHLFNTFNNFNLLKHVKECIFQIYYFWHIFPEVFFPFLVFSGNLRRRKILYFPSTLVSTRWNTFKNNINRVDTQCQEVCHEQDRNGPCLHGAHIRPPWAKMQSAADPPPAPSALRAKPALRGHNFQSPNVNSEKFHRTVCRVSAVWLIAA